MKKASIVPLSLFVLSIVLFACNREQPKNKVVEKKLVCYRSVSGSDTAWLTIDTADKVISGNLKVNYVSKAEIFDGKFIGGMRGDTLQGYYDFRINKANPAFRNPMAFLKSGSKLTMGVGKFKMAVGSAHFDEKVPIDYNSARFIFEEGNCNSDTVNTAK